MIRYYMSEQTDQFLLRLPVDLIKRLEDAARRFGRRSRNQVAAEVLDQCLSIWEQAEAAKLAVLERHRSLGLQLTGESSKKASAGETVAAAASHKEPRKRGRKR